MRFAPIICIIAPCLLLPGAAYAQENVVGDTGSKQRGDNASDASAESSSAADAKPRETADSEAAAPNPEPDEETKAQAADRFQRGLSFYAEGDYALALIEFERVYQLVPDYRVLYNIGQVSIQLSRASQALRALERYLEEGRAELDQARVAEVEADLKMLRARTAHLDLSGTEGAEIFINDESQGTLPLEAPLLLDAGRHQIVVKKSGFEDYKKRVTLAGAETLSLNVQLEAQPAQLSPAIFPTEKQPKEDESDRDLPEVIAAESPPPYATIGWVTTGALAGGALITGILGLSAKSDLDELKSQPDPSEDELTSKANTARALFTATDVLAISALAAAGVSLYFTLGGSDKSAKSVATLGNPRRQDQTATGADLSNLQVGIHAGGLSLCGRF